MPINRYLIFALLILILAGVRLVALDAPLAGDELASAALWGGMPYSKIFTNYQYPNNHIIHTVLISFLLKNFGADPIVLRLPVLLLGFVSLGLAYTTGRRMMNSTRWAWVVTALLGFSASHIYYSTNGRGYMLTQVCAQAVLFLILRRWQKTSESDSERVPWVGQTGDAVSIFVLCVVGSWAIPVFLLFEGAVFGSLLALWFGSEKRGVALGLAGVGCGLIAACVGAYVQYFILIPDSMLKLAVSRASPPSSMEFIPSVVQLWMKPYAFVAWILVPAAVMGLIRLWREKNPAGILLGATLILPFVLIYGGHWMTLLETIPFPRILFFLQPVFFLVAVIGLKHLISFCLERWERVFYLKENGGVVLGLFLAVLGTFSGWNFVYEAYPERSSRVPYHRIQEFVEGLGPQDLFLTSNQAHIEFLLYGASGMRKRLFEISRTGSLDNVYVLESIRQGKSDILRIEQAGAGYFALKDYISLGDAPGTEDLHIPEAMFEEVARFKGLIFYKLKTEYLKSCGPALHAGNIDSWNIEGSAKLIPDPKAASGSKRHAVLFDGPFTLVRKKIERSSGFALRLNLIVLTNSDNPAVFLLSGHPSQGSQGLETSRTWVGNAWTVDHPYGRHIFDRPWRPLVFISEARTLVDILQGQGLDPGMKGMVWGLTSCRIVSSGS